MSKLWSDVRRDVMRRLEENAPGMAFEDRVRVAEDVAREVQLEAIDFEHTPGEYLAFYRDGEQR